MFSSDDTTRICSTCGSQHPLAKEFFNYRKGKNGKYFFSHKCLVCKRKADNEYAANNPDKLKANEQRYKEKHPTAGAESSKRYREKHPEKAKAAKQDWIARNPEKVKAEKQRSHIRCRDKNNKRSSDWHELHKDEQRIVKHEYYLENREETIARVLQYQRDNPEQFRSVQHRRRALEINAEGDFTAEDIADMYEDQGGHCAYCGIGIFWDIFRDVQIEHIVPLSRGGTNWPDNICLSCRDCNLSKASKTLEEWIAVRGW